jgi:N-acetylmuramic acid 6-phosphate etherase
MIQLGKVWSNFMIDLKPTNMKLRARAIKIVSQLSGKSKQQSLDALQAHHWIIKEALQKLGAEK